MQTIYIDYLLSIPIFYNKKYKFSKKFISRISLLLEEDRMFPGEEISY